MRKVLATAVLALFLAGCGHSADTVIGDEKGYKFKGKPIDCMETGSVDDHTLTCDFVGWHQRYDTAR